MDMDGIEGTIRQLERTQLINKVKEQIAQIVGGEKFRLAKAAYDERKRKQEERAIRKLMGKMFPTKRRAREIHPLRQS